MRGSAAGAVWLSGTWIQGGPGASSSTQLQGAELDKPPSTPSHQHSRSQSKLLPILPSGHQRDDSVEGVGVGRGSAAFKLLPILNMGLAQLMLCPIRLCFAATARPAWSWVLVLHGQSFLKTWAGTRTPQLGTAGLSCCSAHSSTSS